jgi:hypothetical protein
MLQKGDSGSAVLDPSKTRVYDFVTGLNCFGKFHVMPLEAVLDQMCAMMLSSELTVPIISRFVLQGSPPSNHDAEGSTVTDKLQQYWPETQTETSDRNPARATKRSLPRLSRAGDGVPQQQRWNVRFAANHTPSSIASAQDFCYSPASASRMSFYPVESHLSTPPRSISPAGQSMLCHLRRSDTEASASLEQQRGSISSEERCPGCGTAWNRPLPDLAKSPAENANGLARANIYLSTRLQEHWKNVDRMYEEWKEEHSYCARDTSEQVPSFSAGKPSSISLDGGNRITITPTESADEPMSTELKKVLKRPVYDDEKTSDGDTKRAKGKLHTSRVPI